MRRRNFLKRAAAAALGGAAVGCGDGDRATAGGEAPSSSRRRYRWNLVTTWPPTLPIFMDGVRAFAEQVKVMSDGRLEIEVFGGGELVPPFEAFDAVSSGTAQMAHGASYYWAGKIPAAQFFASIPFGMNAQQMFAWLYAGGGLELWTEVYEPFGVLPLPAGSTGVQMGGWFNRAIDGPDDFDGLKMRIPGLGGQVLAELGASAVLLPGGEIYTSLERGVIDATEWVGPYHDRIMGFHEIARYYYYPGWHEPGTVLELLIHRPSFEALPADLQQIVRAAAEAQNSWMLSRFEARNHSALRQLVGEGGVEVRQFPQPVMFELQRIAGDVLDGIAAGGDDAARVYASYRDFQRDIAGWGRMSEQAFFNLIQNLG